MLLVQVVECFCDITEIVDNFVADADDDNDVVVVAVAKQFDIVVVVVDAVVFIFNDVKLKQRPLFIELLLLSLCNIDSIDAPVFGDFAMCFVSRFSEIIINLNVSFYIKTSWN